MPSEGHLASWAGVSPGNNKSTGKKKSTRTRSKNKGLKSIFCQAAGPPQKQKTHDCPRFITGWSSDEFLKKLTWLSLIYFYGSFIKY
ncbi:transposase [Brevibacillus sp. NRS-1366]|uniref:transposase n=1 Tax=Brevibacillus sp. NRS-1366 TaxID=3233899 RepID=UPI003D1DC1E6